MIMCGLKWERLESSPTYKTGGKISGIYVIKNKLNDKKYIGQSINIYQRLRSHISTYKRSKKNILLYSAMRKDGVSNFEYSFLELCPKSTLNEREKYWIKKINSIYPNGYNQVIGAGKTGYKLSEETKNKIRNAQIGEKGNMYGKTHSDESRKKISVAIKKHIKNNDNWHLLWTDEHRKKMVEIRSKNPKLSHKKVRIISCDNFGLEFDSQKAAARWVASNTKYKKADSYPITLVCTGNAKTAYGYKWEYVDKKNITNNRKK